MKALMDIAPGEVIGSGVLPESMNEETPVWQELTNTVIRAAGIGRPLGAQLIGTVSEEINHIVQQTSIAEGNMAMIAGDTGVWKWNGAAISLVNQPFTTGGTPLLETWGDWTVGTNNLDKPKVRKGSGTTFVDLAGVNFTKCLQLLRRSPYMLALNTTAGKTNVHWSSDDDIETWAPLASNTAGDMTIRDIPGEIRGGCSLGDSVLIYGQESVTLCTYIGPPYIFSFNTNIHGIGIYGPKAVCECNRKNYGLGPQGAFVTDGYSYELLGDDRFRSWFKKTVDPTRWHKVSVFHTEYTDSIEFRFPTVFGLWATIYWKMERQKFTMGDLRVDAAVERDVFDTPLIGVGTALCRLTREVQDWNGMAFYSTMRTKWMDCGAVEFNKFVDHVFLNGEIDFVDIKVEMQDLDGNERIVLDWQDAQRQNFVLQEDCKARVTLRADDNFHISRIRLYGEVGAELL